MTIASAAAALQSVRNRLVANLETRGVTVPGGLTFRQQVDLVLTIEGGTGPVVNLVFDGEDAVFNGADRVVTTTFA